MSVKKLMINLERRRDRKEEALNMGLTNLEFITAIDGSILTDKEISEANTLKNWRCPWTNRRITKGEYACFMSHKTVWEIVADGNEGVLVLEDDCYFLDSYDESVFTNTQADVVYLGYNENNPKGVRPYNDDLLIPSDPYNLHAYYITPNTAKVLLRHTQSDDFGIIPVDDWFGELLKANKITSLACVNTMARQQPRSDLGTDIEPTASNYLIDYDVHVLTCGTDRSKCTKLYDSASQFNIYPTNIGAGVEWHGTDMSSYGGGHKLVLLREHLKNLPERDLVLFTDAYDVFYTDSIEYIVGRYNDMKARVVFGAEKVCWPDVSLADQFPKAPTAYKYLNSGTIIGEVGELLNILEGDLEPYEDDQLFCQRKYLTGQYDIALDYEQYIFQTHSEAVYKTAGNQLVNTDTQCTGCIYHGNGGDEAKAKYDSLYWEFFPYLYDFMPTGTPVDLTGEMYQVDFLSRDFCEKIIKIADEHGGWEPLPDDLFPAQEIRLSELGLLEEFREHWDTLVAPMYENIWKPMKHYGVRDAFVMKYSVDTQKELNLHTDASLVTGSIKLNDDYEGAELVFPRQGVSNLKTPVGACILFPAMVTHGHECLELTKGTKYSLTIWTSRYQGDYN